MNTIILWVVFNSTGMCGNVPLSSGFQGFSSKRRAIEHATNIELICKAKTYTYKFTGKRFGKKTFVTHIDMEESKKRWPEFK